MAQPTLLPPQAHRQVAEAADRWVRIYCQHARRKARWSGRERKPVALQPRLVAEVSADHIENGRFCHGSRLIRWRDDKEPKACTMDQII
jgi:ATP-dependent DNA ligase